MAKHNLVASGSVVASTPESAPENPVVAPVVVPPPVVADEPVYSSLVLTLVRTWEDGAGGYRCDGIVGPINIKPGFFSGPPPSSLMLSGFNLVAQPKVAVKAAKLDPEKAAKLEARAQKLLAKAESLKPEVNAFAGIVENVA